MGPQTQGASAASEPAPSQSSAEAAQAGLEVLRSLVRSDNAGRLGFNSAEQAQHAQLGDPMNVFMVGLDALKAYKAGTNPSELLTDVHKQIYPVMLDQQTVSSVSVVHHNVGWTATEFGNAAVARALAEHRKNKDDIVVWVPALKVYFVARGSGETLALTPIANDSRFEFKAGESIPASRAFATLQHGIDEYNGLPQ